MAKTSKRDKTQPAEQREGRLRQLRMAFTLTKERDSRLVAWMLVGFVVTFCVVLLILTLVGAEVIFNIVIAVLAGVLAALVIFGRRAQRAAFRQAEGQPGAAAWVLQGMRGHWRTTPAVAGNAQLDAVHRVLGRPGVILVGEGAPHRVRSLLAQEKKRVSRISGDAPIYNVVVGDGDKQVPIQRLSRHLLKLPRNLSKAQVDALDNRLQALGGSRMGLPKGPLPKGARFSGLERTIRRR